MLAFWTFKLNILNGNLTYLLGLVVDPCSSWMLNLVIKLAVEPNSTLPENRFNLKCAPFRFRIVSRDLFAANE